MGCDIHMFVEQKDEEGLWQMLPPPEIELYYYPKTMSAPVMGEDWYWGRNYALFGFLADVRNETGYGTSHVPPLTKPRGLPPHVSAEIQAESDEWDCDGHSHSWFALGELLAINYDQYIVQHRGWVNPVGYQEFKGKGAPSSWSGSVGGGMVEHITNEEMETLIRLRIVSTTESPAFGTGKSYYTEIRWQNSIRENLGDAWFNFIERIKPLAKTEDASDVRVVFWFDN